MSFTSYSEAQLRLHRSELAVPGSNAALFEKAAGSNADVVFLDLEDAVSPEQKEAARAKVIAALNEIDWGEKTMMVRINGLDTHWMYRDVIDVVERCPRLDMLLIPKVGVPADVYAIDMLVTQIERARRVLAAMEAARCEGSGAVALDGKLLDIASIKMAENLLRKAEQLASRQAI